jgi:polyketide biosynthesis acyl carrier protein
MPDRVLLAIRRNVCDVRPDIEPESITEEHTLSELGCDSVDRTDIVSMTMDDLGVSIPVGEFRRVTNIGSLAGVLRDHV